MHESRGLGDVYKRQSLTYKDMYLRVVQSKLIAPERSQADSQAARK